MELETRAGLGDTQAQIALARRHQEQGRDDLARGWFARAAQSGDAAALRLLAVNLLTGAPVIVQDGVGMMQEAARRGDAHASHICAVMAAQGDKDPWRTALDYLAQAAQRGWQPARDELSLLAGAAGKSGPGQWQDMARTVDIAALLAPATVQVKFETPRIWISEGFASPAQCDWLVETARPRLKPATVYNPQSGAGFSQPDIRNNRDTSLDITQSGVIVALLQARLAALMEYGVETMEPPMILNYAPGEFFAPHRDGLDPAAPSLAQEIAAKGQRVATVLIYLNDDYGGGETDFPLLGWRFKGRKGDALIFWNVGPDGMLEASSVHAGLAPEGGEKWVMTQWIRAKG